MSKSNKQRGYTLLFAVITSVMVLGVATFILGVARKQYILSSTARDSFLALNNADSGLQCAVMSGAISAATSSPLRLRCNGTSQTGVLSLTTKDINFGPADPANTEPTPTVFGTDFTVYEAPADSDSSNQAVLPMSNGGCAVIRVWVGYDVTDTNLISVINSRGYNICAQDGSGVYYPAISSRTVERAMQYVTQ